MTLFTIAASAVACYFAGIHTNNLVPLLVSLALLLLSEVWTTFGSRLRALATLVAFSSAYASLVYAFGASPFGFVDDSLRRLDAMLGFDAAAFAKQPPLIYNLLYCVYFAIIPVTILVLLLGDTGFVKQFMICALVAAIIFYFLPALGTCGEHCPSHYQSTVSDLLQLKAGALSEVGWRTTSGLITCPSFHVIWSVLLYMYWPNKFTLIFCALTTPAAIVIGQHYLVDCLAGFAIVYLTSARPSVGCWLPRIYLPRRAYA